MPEPRGSERALPALGPKSGRNREGKNPSRWQPLMPRVKAKIRRDPSTGCWMWTGYTDRDGYAHIGYRGTSWLAHRAVYAEIRGPIPDGLTLDHTCRRRGCVNPAHLEIVEQNENLRRGDSFVGINARKTHCANGHQYTDKTTAWMRDRECVIGFARVCAVCHPDKARTYGTSLTPPEDHQLSLGETA